MLSRRVLLIEDESELRDVVLMALDTEGYETQVARDGGEALAILQEWRPVVILLDLAMPNVDGWGFRARQLADATVADVPVIVLSAGVNLRDRTAALQATAIMPKPFDLDVLLALLSTITAKRTAA